MAAGWLLGGCWVAAGWLLGGCWGDGSECGPPARRVAAAGREGRGGARARRPEGLWVVGRGERCRQAGCRAGLWVGVSMRRVDVGQGVGALSATLSDHISQRQESLEQTQCPTFGRGTETPPTQPQATDWRRGPALGGPGFYRFCVTRISGPYMRPYDVPQTTISSPPALGASGISSRSLGVTPVIVMPLRPPESRVRVPRRPWTAPTTIPGVEG